MQRTATYTVLIYREPEGYVAFAPAFPTIAGRANSGRLAYARLKILLKDQLTELLDKGNALPRDPVFQTRTLRLDLWELQAKVDLA
jgi:predicted RNase H-like HicB family nuclease